LPARAPPPNWRHDRCVKTFPDIAVLLEVMKRLRDGCPWDRSRPSTPSRHTPSKKLMRLPRHCRQRLRPCPANWAILLFQVVFHARMAEEAGLFNFGTVVEAVTEKMIRRHPHVFGDEEAKATAAAQKDFWRN